MTTKIASKIIGIQFSILSADDIKKSSVAQVTSKDTYISNKPVPCGLFDIRMGVIDPGLICPTDGLDYINTPGYFGHLELAKPLFYIQYLGTILKILKSICFKCSRLLISKVKNKSLMDLTPEQRWKHVYMISNKMKRCGEDIEDGCGCKQPKIRKEELATIYADWKNDLKETITVQVTPELVYKIFRKISNEDILFMGFHPLWSRPENMICKVMIIPPPSTRPSIKHDLVQRCEDDLTHILVNILKTNQVLLEKIQCNSSVSDEWAKLLQYHFASLVDNRFPGGASVAQRSGRPLKCLKDRLNGKTGRIRGNLMAKRVDFSARSVITADPNISLSELGIPLRIAKNITKPVVVNSFNKKYLTMLVLNGVDNYPGAKMLEQDSKTITLKYRSDRDKIVLKNGDIVHRHIVDGDAVLFNRQPTLHRMSMMCHSAKIMKKGDTFRLNVAVTKPYNADFDGDEMNLHMSQDTLSDSELLYLAAVKYQMISPANNSPIIGIFQDSMVGAYQFTRNNVKFDHRNAMNLIIRIKGCQINSTMKIPESNFDILSLILPPMTLNYKVNYKAKREDDSDCFLSIENGKYIKGQLDKSVLGSKTKGIIHRICNDYGYHASTDFIDNLQNIVTEYLKLSSFSVGVSDLVSENPTMKGSIKEIVTMHKNEVEKLIQQLKLNVFENNTGKSNRDEFEYQVNNILNRVSKETQQVGLESLDSSNRFRIMVDAGSKGSELNISQMISCVGQQNVDGKRIPYGYDNRTLPHYCKFDDTPESRGFVLNSYVDGLTPQEVFFHAMGGRIGLIDTAVKTSTTGYIQRRLIKGMEDLMIHYDMTVRSNKNKIIQFSYGDDNIDPTKVEAQIIPIASMTTHDIYSHYNIPVSEKKDQLVFDDNARSRLKKELAETNEKHQEYIKMLIESRSQIVKHIFKMKTENLLYCPVAFSFLIENIRFQFNLTETSIVDITLLDVYNAIEECYQKLSAMKYISPMPLFKALFFYFLSPKILIYEKRFHSNALKMLLDTIMFQYKNSIIAPGEMVGMIAAQSIGEPTTQMTLNTFHFCGISSKSNVTRGVPRIEEILSLTYEPKNPSMTIFLKQEDENSRDKAQKIMYMMEFTKLISIVLSAEICFDPCESSTNLEEDNLTMQQFYEFEEMIENANGIVKTQQAPKSKWIIRLELNPEVMMEKNITMEDINFVIKTVYSDQVSCVYSDFNSEKLIFRIRLKSMLKKQPTNKKKDKKLKKTKLQDAEVEFEQEVTFEEDLETKETTESTESFLAEDDASDQTSEIYQLRIFQDQLLENVIIKGVKKIKKVILRKVPNNLSLIDGKYENRDIWVMDTIGSNLIDVLSNNDIDMTKTISNDIMEVLRVFGIEAARQAIFNELSEVIEFDDTYINYHHLCLLCDRMTFCHRPISICRHGINTDDIGPIAKASFEETPEMFFRAAKHGDLDLIKGVSANVLCGQEGNYGTNCFQIILNTKQFCTDRVMDNDDDSDDLKKTDETPTVSQGDFKLISQQVDKIKTLPLGDCSDKYEKGF